MNRNQALEWLVENVTKWPVNSEQITAIESISGFPLDSALFWMDSTGAVVCSVAHYLYITQQDWLDATDNMMEKCDE